MSSPGFSCAWNGSGSALLSSSIFVATTSTWPVRILSLTALARAHDAGDAQAVLVAHVRGGGEHLGIAFDVGSGSATTWTMPSWSRRSMKHRPPRLRATSAQPQRVTVWPIRASSTRPQKWVRMGAPELTVRPGRKLIFLRTRHFNGTGGLLARNIAGRGRLRHAAPSLPRNTGMNRAAPVTRMGGMPGRPDRARPGTDRPAPTSPMVPSCVALLADASSSRMRIGLTLVASAPADAAVPEPASLGHPASPNAVLCRSDAHDSRGYRECRTPFHGRVVLSREVGATRCIEHRNWGWHDGAVWVDQGCGAVFVRMRMPLRRQACPPPARLCLRPASTRLAWSPSASSQRPWPRRPTTIRRHRPGCASCRRPS